MLIDELAHPDVAEPEVVPGYRRALRLYAGDVEETAAGGTGYGALALAVLAETRVALLDVRVERPVGDLVGADGTEDWWACGVCSSAWLVGWMVI